MYNVRPNGKIIGSDRSNLLVADVSMRRPLVLLWDIAEQRELARLPHQSGALSRNGRWFASIAVAPADRVVSLPAEVRGPQRTWDQDALVYTLDDARKSISVSVMDFGPIGLYGRASAGPPRVNHWITLGLSSRASRNHGVCRKIGECCCR